MLNGVGRFDDYRVIGGDEEDVVRLSHVLERTGCPSV
jgi:hypothetical protein